MDAIGGQDRGAILKRSCDLILSDPTLRPNYDKAGSLLTTHCNQGVRLVAHAMGCDELDDENATADTMLSIIQENASGRWKVISGTEATINALSGNLAIAGLDSKTLGEAHGHICIVYPIGQQFSAAFNKDVPMLTNVGAGDPASPLVAAGTGKTRSNWICSASWAFPCKRLGREPNYYLWT